MPEPTTPPAGQVPDSGPPAPDAPESDGPEPAQYSKEYVQRLRREAADARTKLRDHETQVAAAQAAALAEQGKFKELYEAEQARAAKAERTALLLELGADLPPKLRILVQGTTREEIAAHVAELTAELATLAPPPPGGGAPTNPAKAGPAPAPEDTINAYYQRTRGKQTGAGIRL